MKLLILLIPLLFFSCAEAIQDAKEAPKYITIEQLTEYSKTVIEFDYGLHEKTKLGIRLIYIDKDGFVSRDLAVLSKDEIKYLLTKDNEFGKILQKFYNDSYKNPYCSYSISAEYIKTNWADKEHIFRLKP